MPSLGDRADGSSAILGLVDESVRERLRLYVELLGKWRQVTNLISEESYRAVWGRHILDSVYLQKERPEARIWLDIGSGAGMPGVVIACVLAERPDARVHCVEIDRRKCAFLREVASRISLPLKVHNTLAQNESLKENLAVDVVTARAFASLDKILELSQPYLSRGAVAVLPRGRSGHDEVAPLDKALYSVRVRPNPASDDGLFVHIERRGPHNP